MKVCIRLLATWLLLACAFTARSQEAVGPKIDQVNIQYIGPASVSEQFIRSHIQLKPGDHYMPAATQSDIHSLYTTGQFYNIRVAVDQQPDGGVKVTYIVQVKPRLTEIRITGNKKMRTSKIRKKITAKEGQPLDEEKLFMDAQAIKDYYEKEGFPGTTVRYVPDIDEAAGTGIVTFEITEGSKMKITHIEFVGATRFTQNKLRHQIKTRQHWMFSWLTGSDLYKADQFEDDKDALGDFYRNHGFLDFEIKDVQFQHPTPNRMVIQFHVYEGRQYHVGAITLTGATLLPAAALSRNFNPGPEPKPKFGREYTKWNNFKKFNKDFKMKSGDVFTPDGLETNCTAVEDFYGAQGYIGVRRGMGLKVDQIPNVETGTMDLGFTVDEGRKTYVERVDIRGNIKTKDKVIRRELAISPGDVFDMTRVRLSQERLENMGYFSSVDLRPEPTEPPIAGRNDLLVSVQEKPTGNFTVGAGYSSVEALVGFADVSQANFDLFTPPSFTGAGQQARLHIQLGSQDQEYELSFVEPWFLNRKLALGVDLYRYEWDFESVNNIFNETRTGARISLTRALFHSDFWRGTIFYNVEDVGISLNDGWHGLEGAPPQSGGGTGPSPGQFPGTSVPNVPNAILQQVGDHVFNRFGATLAYDTRNNPAGLSNWGQLTELDPEISVGDQTFYKIEAKTQWFFPGLFSGHVIELDGNIGTAKAVTGGDVPFYDRFFLGGEYDLRGFKYRNIGPREANHFPPNSIFSEPIGGDSFAWGSVEYSLPIIEKEGSFGLRFALFYDAGSVGDHSYNFGGNFNDDWGIGLRLNIPRLGPLRLDYGIPITHDANNGSSGQFQFSAGYQRQF
ncbi:MAG TPA: outer membrane protein assembly factor [Verrucomicrobiae bacterium]|jgi:outer membrane protein insertion porin family|nr:outer membrane protein assembly factor [Verrucomicrobiae bacterium]